MQRSKIEVFLHCVWTTARRKPFLTPEIERAVYRCIVGEAARLRCVALSVNGVASLCANTDLGFEGAFDWQDNYTAFSVGSELDAVLNYVRNRKWHHVGGDLWPE